MRTAEFFLKVAGGEDKARKVLSMVPSLSSVSLEEWLAMLDAADESETRPEEEKS